MKRQKERLMCGHLETKRIYGIPNGKSFPDNQYIGYECSRCNKKRQNIIVTCVKYTGEKEG